MANNPLKVHHLRPAPGSKTARTRVGRGEGVKSAELLELQAAEAGIVTVLVRSGSATSNSTARRLLEQRGVKLNGEVVTDDSITLPPGEAEIRVGKRHTFTVRVV